MAIMSKGPGKRTKKTATTKKVTTKDMVSSVKNMFSGFTGGGKNVGKAKGPGALAGLASRTKKNTTSSAGSAVTGKSQVNTKLLEGAVRNLPDTKVTGKKQPVKPTYGKSLTFQRGLGKTSTYYSSAKSIPSDSAKFMQQMKNVNPGAYKTAMDFMKKQQAENPGARFKFGATPVGAVESDKYKARPGEIPMTGKKTKAGQYYKYSNPKISTVLPNKKKKK